MKEQTLHFQNIDINYKISGKGPAIVILHGWGKGSDSWIEIQEKLESAGYLVAVPDLPGFGKSQMPKTVWGVDSYVNFVKEFAEKLNLNTFVLLGYSFGGQIALKFAYSYPEKVEKLLLVAPAAIRKEPGQKEIFIQHIAKAGGVILSVLPEKSVRQFVRRVFARIIGRSDYLEAKGMKRQIMQKVIQEDLSGIFSQITKRTLLVWGENDRPVPVADGYFMKRHIPHAALQIIPKVGHRVNQEAPEELVKIIKEFISSP
jgi:pimeloyl-ACP methyl ester carboxylesterase